LDPGGQGIQKIKRNYNPGRVIMMIGPSRPPSEGNDMLEATFSGLVHVFEISNLVLLVIGVFMGIVFGALPGLTATMGLALLVPFTFTMSPASGLIMLSGIYVGAMYGDAIPAILINTPGTPAAIATTFDGFPLSQKGMAQHGLVAAAVASSFGSSCSQYRFGYGRSSSGGSFIKIRTARVLLVGNFRPYDYRHAFIGLYL
jgi:hypothetical protein